LPPSADAVSVATQIDEAPEKAFPVMEINMRTGQWERTHNQTKLNSELEALWRRTNKRGSNFEVGL
jgi:hypothetical protein